MNFRFATAFLAACCGLTVVVSRAAPLNRQDLPRSAAWYGHIDVAALRTGPVGGLILEQLDEAQQAQLRFFTRLFGFHPIDDVDGITLFGIPEESEEDGVIVLRGRFEREHLLDLVRISEDYERTLVRDHVVHSWWDKKRDERAWGAFIGEDVVLVADHPELIEIALLRVDGRIPAIEDHGFDGFGAKIDPPFVFGLVNLSEIEVEPDAAFLRMVEQALLRIGQSEGKLVASLALRMEEPEIAANVEKVVAGFVALATLNEHEPELAELARRVTTEQSGEMVEIRLSASTEEVIAMLMEQAEEMLDGEEDEDEDEDDA